MRIQYLEVPVHDALCVCVRDCFEEVLDQLAAVALTVVVFVANPVEDVTTAAQLLQGKSPFVSHDFRALRDCLDRPTNECGITSEQFVPMPHVRLAPLSAPNLTWTM